MWTEPAVTRRLAVLFHTAAPFSERKSASASAVRNEANVSSLASELVVNVDAHRYFEPHYCNNEQTH